MDIKKEENSMKTALTRLLEKYNVPVHQPFQLFREDGSVIIQLIPGDQFNGPVLKQNQVPLLAWRTCRKFTELKKILDDAVIEDVSLIRSSCLRRKDKWSLSSVLYREMDLMEFIGNGKIISVQAVITENKAGSVILKLDNQILCSIEVSVQLPLKAPFLERHEIISRRGVAGDIVVDTQIQQHSVYCYSDKGESHYTDTDMELYGFNDFQIDHIRSAFQVLKNPDLMKQWRQQHDHLTSLVKTIFESDRKRRKIVLNKEKIRL